MKKGLFLRGKGTGFIGRGKKALNLNVLNEARLNGKLHEILNLAEGVVDPLEGRDFGISPSPVPIIQEHNKIKRTDHICEDSLRARVHLAHSNKHSDDEQEEYEEFLEFVRDISDEEHLHSITKTDYSDKVCRMLRAIYVEGSGNSSTSSQRFDRSQNIARSFQVQTEEVQRCSKDLQETGKEVLPSAVLPEMSPLPLNQVELPITITPHESPEIKVDSDTPLSSSDLSLSNLNALEVLKKQYQEEETSHPEEYLLSESEEEAVPSPQSFEEQAWPQMEMASEQSSSEEVCAVDFEPVQPLVRSPLGWKISDDLEFIPEKPVCEPSPDISDIFKHGRKMY